VPVNACGQAFMCTYTKYLNLIPVGSGSKMGSHPKSSGPDIAPVKKKSESLSWKLVRERSTWQPEKKEGKIDLGLVRCCLQYDR
jgi:hypothetical protein